MTGVLVGPLPTVRFRDGTKQAYQPPKHTGDPRYRACTNHHPACDCREAEMAEMRAEYVAQLREIEAAARTVLAGHATYAWEDGPNGEREVGCACTGCQIAREAGLLFSANGPHARDKVDGLSPLQEECGMRWEVCTPQRQEASRALTCAQVVTRNRGLYHEHLTNQAGERCPLPEFDPLNECPF